MTIDMMNGPVHLSRSQLLVRLLNELLMILSSDITPTAWTKTQHLHLTWEPNFKRNSRSKKGSLHPKRAQWDHLEHSKRNVVFCPPPPSKNCQGGKTRNHKMSRKDNGYKIDQVLDESRSFFRVHTGYFSNIPKCIKAEFIASWACSQSSVVSSSQR
ncbi:hypothetical protein TNCV_2627741 [Trichonephila clavipes]|uniref:Uncharacterized protein n=1 Tax=Trichonephila clavipes TaxID=2585209 RepID=A0A8X6W7I9_TRICX|nr:hypothetical protein TNCV_2627741 [Trichonephila clavipes]